MPTDDPILANLSDPQKSAVIHPGGPLLIFAGAGSGKTRVLTHRIAYLIQHQNVNPFRILAVTFTNKAAGQMKERVESILPGQGRMVWISTFHSACVRILRRDAHRIGYDKNFVIYDDSDQLSLLKRIIKQFGYDQDGLEPKYVRTLMDKAKCDAKDPIEMSFRFPEGMDQRYVTVCKKYAKELKKSSAFDFGDLIIKAIELLEQNETLVEYYQERLQHILVDEFQDTNTSQYRLLSNLLGEHKNISVVGDDDQSIYNWRGANIQNILGFEKDFPNAKVVILGENYRSSKIIIEAASNVIRGNENRRDKELFTSNPMGAPIALYRGEDEYAEARYASEQILELIRQKGYRHDQIALFYRTNAQSRIFEEEFSRSAIPAKVIGGMRFYERKEIKDILAYLRCLVNPADSVSARRIINLPARGIGKTTVEKIDGFSDKKGVPFIAAARVMVQKELLPKGTCSKLKKFIEMIDSLTRDSKKFSPSKTAELVIHGSGYMAMLEKDKSVEAMTRAENIKELIEAIGEFETEFPEEELASFLEQCALVADQDSVDFESGQVTLMTVHTAKGLEFPAVFICGLEDGLFPHSRSIESETEMEEERRLFYVAITRAEKKVFLTSAEKRRSYGGRPIYTMASRFIEDIPDSLLEVEDYYSKPAFSYSQESQNQFPKPGRITKEAYFTPHPDHVGKTPRGVPDDFLKRPASPKGKKKLQEKREETVVDYSYSQTGEFGEIAVGSFVRHGKLGKGKVIFVEGEGEYATAIVQFDKSGIKKLRLKFAKLMPI